MIAVWNIALAIGAAAVILGLVGVMLSEPGRCRCQHCRSLRR